MSILFKMNKIGVKFLMASGLFLGSGSMISFGYLSNENVCLLTIFKTI